MPKNSFNSIRQNIPLITGTGSSHGSRKIRAWERVIANTIWRTRKVLTLEETCGVFSLSFRQNGICQNDEGEGAAEAHAEVIDQSIRMLRSIRVCRDIGTSDKEELDSLAEAFAHLLSSLKCT